MFCSSVGCYARGSVLAQGAPNVHNRAAIFDHLHLFLQAVKRADKVYIDDLRKIRSIEFGDGEDLALFDSYGRKSAERALWGRGRVQRTGNVCAAIRPPEFCYCLFHPRTHSVKVANVDRTRPESTLCTGDLLLYLFASFAQILYRRRTHGDRGAAD
jgi:hypothetical protein